MTKQVQRFLASILSAVLLLSLCASISFATGIQENDINVIYSKIEQELGYIARDLVNLGIEDVDNLYVGKCVPAYTVKDRVLEPTDTWFFPILDSAGRPVLLAAAYLLNGEREISLSTTFVDALNTCASGDEVAFIYESGGVSLLVNGTSKRIVETPDNEQFGYGSLAAVSQTELAGAGRVKISAAAAITIPPMPLGSDDEEIYLNVEKIKQPDNSYICWAACAASILNYRYNYTKTCESMALQYGVTEFYTEDAAENTPNVINFLNRNYSLKYTCEEVTDMVTAFQRKIWPSLCADCPVYGDLKVYDATAPDLKKEGIGHAVVIRGMSFTGSFCVMDPATGTYVYGGRFIGGNGTITLPSYNQTYIVSGIGYK